VAPFITFAIHWGTVAIAAGRWVRGAASPRSRLYPSVPLTVRASTDAERQAAARAGMASARTASAVGPGPEVEALRDAYLDLLKLSLCDLAGTSTVSVAAMPDGTVASRELRHDQLRLRSAGMDWPLQGLTMVGLGRLDDLQACVQSVVEDGVEGDLLEAGAWRGGASIVMRATLDALGDHERTVWVADSFEGFPDSDDPAPYETRLRAFDFLAIPLGEVKANFARFGLDRGVRFLPGFFEETLPGLTARRWAILRLDCDTYDATKLSLQSLYPGLAVGGYLIIDDYGALEECREAVDEFRNEYGITEQLHEVDWTCVRWRRESEVAIDVPAPVARSRTSNGATTGRAVGPRRDENVATYREIELTGEIERLRARLSEADLELRRLRSSPVLKATSWVRRTLRRDA
jgi:O-methyltransferase